MYAKTLPFLLSLLFFLIPGISMFAGLATTPLLIALAFLVYAYGYDQKTLKGCYPNKPGRHPVLLFCLFLFMCMGLSCLVSINPYYSFKSFICITGLCCAGIMLFYALPSLPTTTTAKFARLFARGYMVGLLLLLMECYTPYGLVRLLMQVSHGDYELYINKSLNRGLGLASLWLWPAVFFAATYSSRKMAALLPVLLLLTLLETESLSALLCLPLGMIVFLLLLSTPKLQPTFRWSLIVALLAMPLLCSMLINAYAGQEEITLPPSAEHRLEVWEFTLHRISERPLIGWGFNSSRYLPGATDINDAGRVNLPLHPHNGGLQAIVELGHLAFILLVIALAKILRNWQYNSVYKSQLYTAASAATFFAFFFIGCTAFGIWQGWWFAAAWLTASLFQLAGGSVTIRSRSF